VAVGVSLGTAVGRSWVAVARTLVAVEVGVWLGVAVGMGVSVGGTDVGEGGRWVDVAVGGNTAVPASVGTGGIWASPPAARSRSRLKNKKR